MNPLWYHLLEEQTDGLGVLAYDGPPGPRIGLTPAFILGAIRSNDAEVPGRDDLLALLESMRDTDTGKGIRIAECPSIHQPRVSFAPSINGYAGVALKRAGGPSFLWSVPQYFTDPASDIQGLTDGLWKLIGPHVSLGSFSYRARQWQPFNDIEQAFIQRARARAAV